MAKKVWTTIKVQNCEHAGGDVSLDAQVLYPEDMMPDTPPRIVAHRCSRGLECALSALPSFQSGEEASCVWAGTNPTFDPFAEKPEDKK